MNSKPLPKRKRRRWLRVILWVVGVILLLPIFIVLLFQLSPVQTFTKKKVESYLRNKFHTTVLIGSLRLKWWNSLSIEKVYLEDKAKQPLLYSGSLNVSFNLLALTHNELVIKKLHWDDILINIYRRPGDAAYNYQFIIDAFASPEKKDTISESGTTLTYSIGNVELNKFRLRYNDISKGTDAIARWDHLLINPSAIQPEVNRYAVNRIQLGSAIIVYSDSANNKWGIRHFNLDAEDVKYSTDSILANVHTLTLQEKKGFAIKQFHGDVLYSNKEIALKNLLLQTNKSRLASEVVAKVPSWTTIKDSLSRMQVKAVLENAHLDLTEVTQLLPDLKNNKSLRYLFRKIIDANGKITGSMQRLQVNELNLADNDGSKVFVTGVVQNATDYNHLLADVKEIDVQSGARSIKSWLPAGTIPDSIAIPVQIHLTGAGTYSKNAILADLKLNTSDGDIIINGNAANYTDVINSRYDVRIPLLRVNAGKLLRDTTLGLINASLSAKGSGYDYKRLIANINLLIKEAVYNNYRYQNIHSIIALNKGRFDLDLQSKDPNVLLNTRLQGLLTTAGSLTGTIDLKKADFYATHWSKTPLAAKLNAAINVPSLQPRHLKGEAIFSNIQLADDSTLYALDTLRFLATDTINQQQINISGPFGFLKADGAYDYTTAFTDLITFAQQHLQSENKVAVSKARQVMDLQGSLLWPRSLQHLMPGLTMRKPLTLTGHFNTDSSLLNIDFLLPAITFNDFKLDTLRGSINNNADSLLSKIYLAALEHPQFPLEQTTLDIAAKNGLLNADLNLLDKNDRKKYALGTTVKFLPNNGLSLSLKPDLLLNKTSWTVSEGNSIVLAGGTLRSADLSIFSRGQSLSVKTVEKGTTTPDLQVNIDQFKLSTISAAIEQDSLFAEGVLTARATVSNYTTTPAINATLNVDSLKARGISVGTLNATVNSPQSGIYNVKAQLTGSNNDVDIEGRYADQLDFNVDLKRLNMSSIEPFTMGNVKRMSGTTSGKITVKGTPSQPIVRGTVHFDTVAGNVTAIGNYLKIPNNDLAITNEGITFNNFIITDSLDHQAVINGSIRTRDYKDYRLQLTLDAENFMAVGPKQSPDQLFYGPTFIDANARIRGTQDLPRVDLNMVLRDSTSFTLVIPETDAGIASREGVIVFVDRDTQLDSSLLHLTDTVKLHKPQGLKGVALTARVEITPSSTLKIIVDQQNGDYLEVKGKANLDASMTPNSDLILTGRYELDEGKYAMSFNNFIKRSFDIEKGSSITFQGNPMNALVDITARYRVNAVAGDLVEDQLSGASDIRRNQFKQKVPVDVYLQIKNELLKPDISFRLDMPERERNVLNGVIYNRIKQINGVESELNKQVMGLLVLNSFIPENPVALINERGGIGVESTAKKSVSKLISQQLNNFAGSLIKGFNINFDLNTEDDYTTGTLQSRTDLNIGVSKSLFNDRVSVSVGSSVNLEGTPPSQQTNNLVGDASVEYKITPDGKYRLRAYRQNETDAIVEGQIIETGASFIFTVDYNELRELFHSKKKEQGIIKKRGK